MELLTSCGLFVSGYEFCTTGAEDVVEPADKALFGRPGWGGRLL